ncbi:MAG: phage terminase large subunit family protein [Gammaproteobacteria bacterium]|nr:phage terminase large subunit family protein [Gammaproteobacteria bacterium]
MTAAAAPRIAAAISRAVAPRKPMRVSDWAAANRILSSKASNEPGRWRNDRNPLLVEPMDCFSARSPVREVVCRFPIQFGKSELECNVLGYTMSEVGGPIMVTLPGQVSLDKWIDQKLNPLLEETPAVRRTLASTASRDASNRRTFKEFEGGQLYLEHAGNPARLKSTSVRTLIVDEFSSFASACRSGDDPDQMLDGRNSAFPATYKRLKVGTPEIRGVCRIDALFAKSDQRHWHVPCPDCGHRQPLEWSGLHWTPDVSHAWYVCRECGVVIEESQKDALIDAGGWVAHNPGADVRGYAANGLYYKIGRGPRWIALAREWVDAQNDPAKLKTFINDRLAEAWEDPAMRAVKHNLVADRVEPRPLRPVPAWVLAVTAGIDTQDDRLPVQLVGWGRGLRAWPIDYVELPGDPAEDDVWAALTDLLNRPIEHELGGFLRVEASAQDAAGHRTEAVKAFARQRRVRRHLPIFGAKPNNAPVLSKGTLVDVNWRGQYDKRGIKIHHVGTVGIKHLLYSRLSSDADKAPEDRLLRFSDELEPAYFGGLVSETYNPAKNRFEKRRGGPRNEPLDTWVYAYAATHHPELRLHRWTNADWDRREALLRAEAETPAPGADSRGTPATPERRLPARDSRGTPARPRRRGALIDPT